MIPPARNKNTSLGYGRPSPDLLVTCVLLPRRLTCRHRRDLRQKKESPFPLAPFDAWRTPPPAVSSRLAPTRPLGGASRTLLPIPVPFAQKPKEAENGKGGVQVAEGKQTVSRTADCR